MDFEKLIKSCFPEEDQVLSVKIQQLRMKLKEIETKLEGLKCLCKHPRKFIEVNNEGYDIPDGYGGDSWSGNMYEATCKLCGELAGRLDEDRIKGTYTGTCFLEKTYQKAREKELLDAIEWQKKQKEKEERAQLKHLQEKYGKG